MEDMSFGLEGMIYQDFMKEIESSDTKNIPSGLESVVVQSNEEAEERNIN